MEIRRFFIGISALAPLAAPVSSEDLAVRLRHRTITGAEAGIGLPAGAAQTMIVRASGAVTADWKRALQAAGATLVTYLPDNAFLVRVPRSQAIALGAVRGTAFAAPYLPGDKLAPELAAALDARDGQRLPLHVLVAPDVPASRVARALSELGLEVSGQGDGGVFNDVGAFLPPGRLDLAERVADLDGVLWVGPRARRVLLNDTSIWVGQSGLEGGGATPIHDHGILGRGQTVAVLDTGLDYDMCFFRDPAGPPPVNVAGGIAFDPTRRKVVAYDFLFVGDDPGNRLHYDNHGHGSHVAGSAAGDNDLQLLAHDPSDGMAPGAKLVIQDGGFATDDCADLPGLGCPVVDLTPIFDQAYVQGARLHSNSWGDRENFVPQNTYSAGSVDTDDFMWTHPDFLILYAAGNSGPGAGTVGSPSTAKNTIAVGATNRGSGADTIAGFSSIGMAADGRLKPTVTAPGVSIQSADADGDITTGNCGTAGLSGTSMACPTAAGLAALAREYFTAGYYPSGAPRPVDRLLPSAALIKATVINSGRQMRSEGSIPNATQGWGRITLGDTLFFPGAGRDLFVVDEKAGFDTGASTPFTYQLDVRGSDTPLKVTLVWTDPPSNPMAAVNLVNDLDLRVTGPSGAYLGNVFSAGESILGGSADRLNVEEQVRIVDPVPGIYTVEVAAFAVPMGPQPFALVVTANLPTPLFLRHELQTIASDENGNGWLDPGETIQLAVTLANASDETATAVSGRLESGASEVVMLDDTAAFADIMPGALVTSDPAHFTLQLGETFPCGSAIPFRLHVTAAEGSFDMAFEVIPGGFGPVFFDDFESTPLGQTPSGWTVSSNRPAFGKGVTDGTVEPVAGSPGPTSGSQALFVGKDGPDDALTATEVTRQIDLSAYAGRPVRIGFRWWAYDAEATNRLVAGVSDIGPPWFNWELLRTPTPFDSNRDGGNLWGTTLVDLSELDGFDVGANVWIRFDTRIDQSEDRGDGFYVDDFEVTAVSCQAVVCTAVTADASATSVQPVCPNSPVVLDGIRSSPGGCTNLEQRWYQGSNLLGIGVTETAFPLAATTYRLDAQCVSPVSCVSSDEIAIPVLPAVSSSVVANSLRVRSIGSAVEITWGGGVGTGFNVHGTTARSEVGTLWTGSPMNATPLGSTMWTDSPPAGGLTYYRAFGTNDCNNRSMP